MCNSAQKPSPRWFFHLCALCVAVALSPRASAQTFTLDGQFSSPGALQFSFQRGSDCIGADGLILPQDEPRFTSRPRLLCGAPQVRNDQPPSGTFGAAIMAAASGVAHDGVTPLLLMYAADAQRLQLRQVNPDGSYTVIHDKSIGHPAPDTGPRNILRGEPSDREAEGIRYEPFDGFIICHGLLTAICQVDLYENGQWVPDRSAVCYWDMAAPNLGWRYVDIGPAASTQHGLRRGSSFQHTGYRVLDPGPVLEAWFPFSDYVQNNQPTQPGQPNAVSDTGVYYLVSATRPAVGAPWTVGPLKSVYKPAPRVVTPVTLNIGQHAHPPFLERFGAAGLRMVCPLGDSWPRNRVVVAVCPDENYTAPWTIYENTHGSTGTEFDAIVGVGNQFMASAPLGTPLFPLGHVVGGDEMGVPLARAILPATAGGKTNFARLYGQPAASYNHFHTPARTYTWNVFHASSASPESGGPFVAQMLPGMQSGWFFDLSIARVLFSHDGLTWGQAWATQDVQPWPPRVVGGRIFTGSTDRIRNFGMRSIPIPATRTARPLMIGSGGDNLLAAGVRPDPASVDAGNSVIPVSRSRLAPRGIPLPPAGGDIYECVLGAAGQAGGRRLGTWQLTRGGAVVPREAPYAVKSKVRVWMYPLPTIPGVQPHANSFIGYFGVGRYDPKFPANPIGSAREEYTVGAIPTVGDALGGWLPITFDADTSRWTAEAGRVNNAPPQAPFDIGLRIRTDSNLPLNQGAFLIAFESVLAGADSAWGVTPAYTGPFAPEQARISGFTCGPEWTIRLAGEVPDDAWDQTLGADQIATPLTLCTLSMNASSHIQVRADVISRALQVVVTSGGVEKTIPLRPAGHHLGRERFAFLRGSPVLLAVSRRGGKISVLASVGGSTVAAEAVSGADIRPTQVVLGDAPGEHPASMLWYGGRVDAATGLSWSDAGASLATLNFLQ